MKSLDTPTLGSDGNHPELSDSITPIIEDKKNIKEQSTTIEDQPQPFIDAIKTVPSPTLKSPIAPTEKTSNIPPNVSATPTPSVKTGSLPLTEQERKEIRSRKFGGPVSEPERKKARQDRFSTSGLASGLGNKEPLTEVDKDKIAKRAERFGPISSINSSSESDRLKNRQARFADDKIKKRQERFGVVQPTKPTDSTELRKQQRAMKFGIK